MDPAPDWLWRAGHEMLGYNVPPQASRSPATATMERPDPIQRRSGSKGWNAITLLLCVVTVIVGIQMVGRLEVPSSKVEDQLTHTSSPSVSKRGASHLGLDYSIERGSRQSLKQLEADQLALSATTHKILAGVYVMNNFGLNLSIPAYSSSGQIWLIWEEPLQRYMDARKMEINDLVSAVNLLDQHPQESLKKLTDEPIRLGPTRYMQRFSYQGQFKIDRTDMKRYPFNSLSLPLIIEAVDPFGNLNYSNLRIIADTGGSGLGQFKAITGWINEGWSVAEFKHVYTSGLGDQNRASSTYSQIAFESIYRTSTWASLWNMFQPLAVVMTMVILIPKLEPQVWEVRIGTPVTILLTLIFLQQGYKNTLPPLPYLTFIDKVYAYSFTVTLLTFGLSIWMLRRTNQAHLIHDPKHRAMALRQLDLVDNLFAPVVMVSAVLATGLAWSTS